MGTVPNDIGSNIGLRFSAVWTPSPNHIWSWSLSVWTHHKTRYTLRHKAHGEKTNRMKPHAKVHLASEKNKYGIMTLPGIPLGFSSGNKFQYGCFLIIVLTNPIFNGLLHNLLCVRTFHTNLFLQLENLTVTGTTEISSLGNSFRILLNSTWINKWSYLASLWIWRSCMKESRRL